MGRRKKNEVDNYVSKGSRSIVKQALYDSHTADELVNRVRKDLKRGQFSYLTPYLVSEKYSISISTAKKILRVLLNENAIRVFSGGRRAPLYVPTTSK